MNFKRLMKVKDNEGQKYAVCYKRKYFGSGTVSSNLVFVDLAANNEQEAIQEAISHINSKYNYIASSYIYIVDPVSINRVDKYQTYAYCLYAFKCDESYNPITREVSYYPEDVADMSRWEKVNKEKLLV